MFEADNLMQQALNSSSEGERERLAQQCLTISRGIGHEAGVDASLLMLGQISARNGRYDDAMEYLLEAENRMRKKGNKQALLGIYATLGELFTQVKLPGNAIKYYNDALRLNPGNEETQEKIGDAYIVSNKPDSAEIFYKKPLARYTDQGNFPKLVQIYQKLAGAYEQQKNTEKSLGYYGEVEKIIENNGNSAERAMLYNNMGRQYSAARNYPKALEYFRKAELQCTYIPCDYPEVVFANLGVAYHNTGNPKRGIDYLIKATRILNDKKDYPALAELEHLIATYYFKNRDVYNALTHNDLAIRYSKSTKRREVLVKSYRTAADIYQELYDFEKAIEFYREYLKLSDTLSLETAERAQRLSQQHNSLTQAEGEIRFLLSQQSVKDLELEQERNEKETLRLRNDKLALEAQRREDELLLLQKNKEVDAAKQRELILQALRARQEANLAAQQRDILSQQQQLEMARAASARQTADSLRQAQEVFVLQRDKDIARLELDREKDFRQAAKLFGVLGAIILALLALGWWFNRRTNERLNKQNRKIQAQNKEIAEERQKSEQLLLNILPDEIASELKTRGYASPRFYDSATVLFTDFVNFTKLSEQLSPQELIDELDACFLGFDEICERYGLEKIKTIGDAYMCAGGLPVVNTTHPLDAVRAAQEMLAFLDKRNRENPGARFRQMRLGIHTGPVVAGVIGKNKFAYDIWGDAVNLAARLEALSEPGRINISGITYEAIKDQIPCSYRGIKDVHNKGKVEMYFVD